MIQKPRPSVVENFLTISELSVQCKIAGSQLDVCFVNPNTGSLFCRLYQITEEQKESFSDVENLKQYILNVDGLENFVANTKTVFNSAEEDMDDQNNQINNE